MSSEFETDVVRITPQTTTLITVSENLNNDGFMAHLQATEQEHSTQTQSLAHRQMQLEDFRNRYCEDEDIGQDIRYGIRNPEAVLIYASRFHRFVPGPTDGNTLEDGCHDCAETPSRDDPDDNPAGVRKASGDKNAFVEEHN